jgi:hypothetical protein
MDEATRAHDKHRDKLIAGHSSVIDFAKEALRTATLVSGGSAAATLAFISGNAKAVNSSSHTIVYALTLFAIAVFSAGVGTGFSYLAQYRYGFAGGMVQFISERPFVEDTVASSALRESGNVWRMLAIACVVVCYLAVFGGYCFSVAALWNGVP